MYLTDFFNEDFVIRDISFETSFCPFFEQPKSIGYANNEKTILKLNQLENVVGIITVNDLVHVVKNNKGIVISDNPQKSYYELHNKLIEQDLFSPLHQHYISKNSEIADTAIISEKVFIGDNVKIGHGVIIHENSYIDEGTIIEDYAVIGVKGMQNTSINGDNFKVKYAGGVKIGKNCQILSHAIIQKPYQRFYTEIGDNVQISVKVVIGHGVQIGKHSSVAGNTQISGNVKIGEAVLIAPSVTISDGIQIGNNANIKIGSVVISDVEDGKIVSGNFAISHQRNLLNYLKMKRK